jgi:hypothetical protein
VIFVTDKGPEAMQDWFHAPNPRCGKFRRKSPMSMLILFGVWILVTGWLMNSAVAGVDAAKQRASKHE